MSKTLSKSQFAATEALRRSNQKEQSALHKNVVRDLKERQV